MLDTKKQLRSLIGLRNPSRLVKLCGVLLATSFVGCAGVRFCWGVPDATEAMLDEVAEGEVPEGTERYLAELDRNCGVISE